VITVTPHLDSEGDTLRWDLLQQNVQRARSVRAVELLRSHGIEPILIKGVAAEQWYPDGKVRLSTDVDLAVSGADFARAAKLVRSPEASGSAIDLHRELRHLDSLPWADLIKNSVEMRLNEGVVLVLRPEDHLRVLCVHWLTDGGAYRERLWDIFYAIHNRPEGFDWSRFLDEVGENRRRWLTCAVGLAEKYLRLHLSSTPLAGAAATLPDWLIRSVETEWSRDSKLVPLEVSLFVRGEFTKQLKDRLRPNPVWATIQAEGSFDARTRIFYQVASFFRRAFPSLRRIVRAIGYHSK
jgi:hypothetical protein